MSEHAAIDWLSICDRVRSEASRRGYESLSPIERAVHLSDNFNFEQENGGLSQFFYNSDCSAAFAEATALALRTIGAPRTGEVVSQAASLFTQTPDGTLSSTWREYLSAVDPQNRLRDFDRQLPISSEDIFSLMEATLLSIAMTLHETANQADAPNAAIALRFHFDYHRRGVGDLHR